MGYEDALAPLVGESAAARLGTGLGTRIVNNMADAHGGLVEVASELGVGTTIRCKILVQRAET